MWLDRLLSYFQVQTKVLIFVIPFILSLGAVVFTSAYTSSRMEKRMNVSNALLEQLSGFKEVFSSINEFRQAPNDNSFQSAERAVDRQVELISQTGTHVGDITVSHEIEDVAAQTTALEHSLNEMWQAHQAELASAEAIEKGNAELAGLQGLIGKHAATLIADARQQDRLAQKSLQAAQQIGEMTSLGFAMAEELKVSPRAEEKQSILSGYALRFVAALDLLRGNSKEKAKSLRPMVEEQVKEWRSIAASDDVNQVTVRIDVALRGMLAFTAKIKDVGDQAMRDAVQTLVSAEKSTQHVDQFSNVVRSLSSKSDQIKLNFSELKNNPDEITLAAFVRTLRSYGQDIGQVAKFGPQKDEFFGSLSQDASGILRTIEDASRSYVESNALRVAVFSDAAQQINAAWAKLTSLAELQQEHASRDRRDANAISATAMLAGIVVAIFAAVGLVVTFKGPINRITAAMRRLSEGSLDTSISGADRADEIGEMARALGVFRENAVTKIEIERRADEERASADADRTRNDAEKAAMDREIDYAVTMLGSGLERLANADISMIIDTPFAGSLERLRLDFNGSLRRLEETLAQIRENAQSIQYNIQELSGSADNLSRRTEQQAASLEQTAAAVDELSEIVKLSAERAEEADQIMLETKRSADQSVIVVESAIAAMDRIEGASERIVQIIDVIDEIAFQTNLLALNAGIEAARAGEAGRGFAVVAMEVRQLAQRSASAAQEIKCLIDESTAEISSGARLVEQTGQVLTDISAKIGNVSGRVAAIASAAREQANALSEVNTAVNQMDQITQRNAEMVEESNSATRQLEIEATSLVILVDQFKFERAIAVCGVKMVA
jgi:methyl-accepting chemotaxis protein